VTELCLSCYKLVTNSWAAILVRSMILKFPTLNSGVDLSLCLGISHRNGLVGEASRYNIRAVPLRAAELEFRRNVSTVMANESCLRSALQRG
jgi:hypothetical protein